MIDKNSLSSRMPDLITAAALVLVTVIAYGPVVDQRPVNFDDTTWLKAVEPPTLRTVGEIFACDPDRWHGLGYYAPLVAASFVMDVWIGDVVGDRVAVHKAVNLGFHAINVVLVLLLARMLGLGRRAAFFAALLFALHPLQVSTVAWIAERKNVLAAFFLLSGLVLYTAARGRSSIGLYVGVLGLYIAGLLSKPSVVALGPCIFLTDVLMTDRRFTWGAVYRCLPFIILGLVWTAIAAGTEGATGPAPSILERIVFVPYKVGFLLGKFVLPLDLSFQYASVDVDMRSPIWWAPTILLFIVAIGIIAALIRYRIHPVAWGLAFYGVNLLPSLGLVPFHGMERFQVADHYQYIAMTGIAIAVGYGIDRCLEMVPSGWTTALVIVITVILGTGLFVMTRHTLRIWDGPEALWRDVTKKNPMSFIGNSNYGQYLEDRGRPGEAIPYLKRALHVKPESYKIAYKLGMISLRMGRLSAADRYMGTALEVEPRFGQAHLAMAKIRFTQGRYDEALEHCRLAERLGEDCRPKELERAIRDRVSPK